MSLQVTVGGCSVPFDLWRPGQRLDGSLVAFDTETEKIDESGAVPRFVIGVATEGRQGFFIAMQHLGAFFKEHADKRFLMHNAAFDLAVLDESGVALRVLVERGQVLDTGLLYRLIKLAEIGFCNGPWALDHVVPELTGVGLPKDVRSCDGCEVRTSYGRFLGADGVPDYATMLRPEHLPYLIYAASDSVATLLVASVLTKKVERLFPGVKLFAPSTWVAAPSVAGINVARAWGHHGFLTHDIQLKASIALAAIERRGMHIDSEQITGIVAGIDAELTAAREALASRGWTPGVGSQQKFSKILTQVEAELKVKLPRTDTGAYSRAADDLAEFRESSDFIDLYLRHEELNKIRSTFLTPLEQSGVVRGKFNTLVNSGRTSCSGRGGKGLNLQNVPSSNGVREGLVPAPGHLLLSVDYSGIELTTLSQHMLSTLGWSKMAEAIRRGADLHALYAVHREGHDISQLPGWSKSALMPLLGHDGEKKRKRSKPVNFGFPGGLGARSLVEYARNTYGVEMTEDEARAEKETWLKLWPEMRHHLESDELRLLAVRHPDIWASHPRAGGGVNNDPVPWPIHILRGVVCGRTHTKTSGRVYSTEEIDWAWRAAAAVLAAAGHLTDEQRTVCETRIRERIAGVDLWSLITPRTRFSATLTGRLRGYPRYCAARNNVFQGLAADGAKLALYRLHCDGYRVVNFLHDEVLVELPESADMGREALRIVDIMIAAMREVVPDLPVACEYALMRRWSARAEAVFEFGGRRMPLTDWERHQMDDRRLIEAGASLVMWEPA